MAEELIQPGSRVQDSRVPGFVAGTFLLALVLTGAAEILFPPAPLVLVGQEQRDSSEAAKQIDFWDGSLAQSIETDFRLRGRVRRALAPYWAAGMLMLGDTPDDELIVGKDGWLFLRDRVEFDPLQRVSGREQIANLFSLVRRSLASADIDFVCFPVPRKAAVCAEMLPEGFDGDLAYDASVIAALQSRGIKTIDVIPFWSKLPVEGRYLRYDTHWALPARLEAAKQIARQAPSLPRNGYDRHFSFRYGEERLFNGNLRFAGVDYEHPANAFFDAETDREIFLIPAKAENDIASGVIPSTILYAGSSFSAHFWLQAIMCNMLQTPVEDASEPGQLPLYSLRKSLLTRTEDELPRHVIHEFPIHQAAASGRGAEPITRGAMGIARIMHYSDLVQPLPEDLFRAPATFPAEVGRPIVHYAEGTLLSSGDGVLGMSLDFDGEAPSQWQYFTPGAIVEIGAKKGRRIRNLPILESVQGIGGFAWLKPRNELSLGTSIKTGLVTSADLASGTRFDGEDRADGAWVAHPKLSVSDCDSLALQWDDFQTGPVELVATGTDAEGAPVEHTWSFTNAREVRFLIVTLGPFEGGELSSLTLRGGGSHVEGTLAGLIRAR